VKRHCVLSLVLYLVQLYVVLWHCGHEAEFQAIKALQAFNRQSSTQRIRDAAEALVRWIWCVAVHRPAGKSFHSPAFFVLQFLQHVEICGLGDLQLHLMCNGKLRLPVFRLQLTQHCCAEDVWWTIEESRSATQLHEVLLGWFRLGRTHDGYATEKSSVTLPPLCSVIWVEARYYTNV